MFSIQITEPAKADIQDAFSWWSENRSQEQAKLWYEKIYQAISTLKRMPERCPVAPETELSISGVRQLLFGVGKHPTHRIVFVIDHSVVRVLRVRHHGQDALSS